MKSLLLLSLLASASYAISENEVNDKKTPSFVNVRDVSYSTPAVIYFGTTEGHILRCLQDDPEECEFVYKNQISSLLNGVNCLLIRGQFIYAGLNTGDLLRCDLNVKPSCVTFESFHTPVDTLAQGEGYLFVGLRNYTIMQCEEACQPLHKVSNMIDSLFFDKYIYVGQSDGQISRCDLNQNCTTLKYLSGDSPVTGFARMGRNVFVTTWRGRLWNCTRLSSTGHYGIISENDCVPIDLNLTDSSGVAAFNGSLYVHNSQGICKMNGTECVRYAAKNTSSMAFAYSTYYMQSRYKNEQKTCTRQRDSECQLVIYYNERQRATLEVHVKDGRLYSQDNLVDTTGADEGQTGPAAIFAMGLDGRIILSNWHKKGVIHTSSLFAGSPVSGAGEIVVKNGVIQKITACSEHYKPDLDLNRQVIQSLRTQGNTDPIDLRMCCKDDGCSIAKDHV